MHGPIVTAGTAQPGHPPGVYDRTLGRFEEAARPGGSAIWEPPWLRSIEDLEAAVHPNAGLAAAPEAPSAGDDIPTIDGDATPTSTTERPSQGDIGTAGK